MYGGTVFFYDSKRIIGEVLFFNHFSWSEILSRKWNAWKILSGLCAEQNRRVEQKRVVFCSFRCFRESEKLRCEKISVSERNFEFTCGFLKTFFLFINSRPHLLSRLLLRSYFFFLLRQTFFRFTILPLFRHFAWNLFDFSRLVSLFSHSAKSEFEHQLLSKAIQNEQSGYEKLKSEIETG